MQETHLHPPDRGARSRDIDPEELREKELDEQLTEINRNYP